MSGKVMVVSSTSRARSPARCMYRFSTTSGTMPVVLEIA